MKALLGKIETGKFLSTAAKNAGLQHKGKKVTNHSVRKTCISRLFDADIPENVLAQLSGHKSEHGEFAILTVIWFETPKEVLDPQQS